MGEQGFNSTSFCFLKPLALVPYQEHSKTPNQACPQELMGPWGELADPTYQQIHRAAHAVVFALICHHTPVIEQLLQEAFDQVHKVFHWLENSRVFCGTLHQAAGRDGRAVSSWPEDKEYVSRGGEWSREFKFCWFMCWLILLIYSIMYSIYTYLSI